MSGFKVAFGSEEHLSMFKDEIAMHTYNRVIGENVRPYEETHPENTEPTNMLIDRINDTASMSLQNASSSAVDQMLVEQPTDYFLNGGVDTYAPVPMIKNTVAPHTTANQWRYREMTDRREFDN